MLLYMLDYGDTLICLLQSEAAGLILSFQFQHTPSFFSFSLAEVNQMINRTLQCENNCLFVQMKLCSIIRTGGKMHKSSKTLNYIVFLHSEFIKTCVAFRNLSINIKQP